MLAKMRPHMLKMHQSAWWLGSARTCWESLQCTPRLNSWI